MQILKENKIVTKYLIPIIMLPVVCLILNYMITFIFQIGKYYGTFIRGLYELVLNHI